MINGSLKKLNWDAVKSKFETVMNDCKAFWETEDMNLLFRITAHDAYMLSCNSDANEMFGGWYAALFEFYPRSNQVG